MKTKNFISLDIKDILGIILSGVTNEFQKRVLINNLLPSFPLDVKWIKEMSFDGLLKLLISRIDDKTTETNQIKNLISDLFKNYSSLQMDIEKYLLGKGFNITGSKLQFTDDEVNVQTKEQKIPFSDK